LFDEHTDIIQTPIESLYVYQYYFNEVSPAFKL